MARTTSQNTTPEPAVEVDGKHRVTVHHLMKTRVVSCAPGDSLHRVAQLMWENDIGAVPVVDAGSRVVGMLTDRDIAMAVYLRGQPLSQISAESTMSREVYSLKPSDSPHQAALVMRLNQIRRLPIVDDNGTLVGMLTLSDLARATEPGPSGPIAPSEVSDTLRTIYAPRLIAANNVIA